MFFCIILKDIYFCGNFKPSIHNISSMRHIYKVVILSVLTALCLLPLHAQTQMEIEMAKSMAKAQGYSDSEIAAMINKQQSGNVSKSATVIQPPVARVDTAMRFVTDTVSVVDGQNERIFGHNIFQSPGLNFMPSYNIPTPADYRLAPGDEIVIDIWGATYINYNLTVSPEGSITIPDVGPVYLAGSTVENAERKLKDKLSTVYSGLSGSQPNTFLRLSVGRIRSFTVNVVGDAVRPGTYTLPSLSTVFSAIYLAGGPTDLGSVRDIRIYRGNKLVETLDVYKFIIDGDFSKNIRLEDNDLIMIPPYAEHVTINGNVKRPMIYDMKPGETISDLLKYAAGFSDNANDQLVRVTRVNGERTETFNVLASQFAGFVLKDGDVVTATPNIDRNKNIVTIRGAVWHPGSYAISNDVSTVKQLIDFAGGLRDEAFMDRGYIVRLDEKRDTIALYFNVSDVMSGVTDIPLFNEDHIRIFSNTDMSVRTNIETRGYLNNPSVLPFRPGITLGDAILLSGGLSIGASRTNIDVARRNILDNSERSDTISIIYNFNIIEDPSALNFELKPYDIISVRPSPSYKAQQGITVNGEVVFPGYYVIESNVVRLSDVVARTGGCTPDAYLDGATIERLLSEEEYQRAVQAARLALREEGVDSTMIEMPDRNDRYKIGINLKKALEDPGSYNDIILQNGDVVNIPKLNNTVKISGAVLYPNTVVYDPSISVNQYIKMAGGYVKGAIKRKKYIVFMNGTASTMGGKNFKPMPGCEIIVPQRDLSQRERISAAEIVSIASSTTSIATMVITMVNMLSK